MIRSLASSKLGAVLLMAATCSGCSLFGGLRVEGLATGAQRPSNVAAFVRVSDGGEPVTELGASDFTVYEDNKALTPLETRQTLLDRDLAASFRTLLAVDLSAAKTPEQRAQLARAIVVFVEKVRETQPVTVLGFDGQAQLRVIAEFARGESSRLEAARFSDLVARDQSRNLNGAVVRANSELENRLAQSGKALRVGTLVIFAAGPDLAHRVDDSEVERSLAAHSYAHIAIALGEPATAPLRELGHDGLVTVANHDALGVAFEEAAYKVRNEYEKHYLISYCSPARAGSRALRLEVRFTNKKGDDHKGAFASEFDARGFGPGCDPSRLPRLTPVGETSVARTDKKPNTATDTGAPAQPADSDAPGEPAPSSDDADRPVVPPPQRPGYQP